MENTKQAKDTQTGTRIVSYLSIILIISELF